MNGHIHEDYPTHDPVEMHERHPLGNQPDGFQTHADPVGAWRRFSRPFAGVSREQLKREAEAFATQSGLKDKEKEIFRGALVAQHVSNIDQLEDITPDERFWLRSEVTHPYKLPRPLLFTIILCALGAAVQGWDQEGINGAYLFWPAALGLDDKSAGSDWLIGLVNAAPYFGSAFIGGWLSDPLNNMVGRRGTIFFAAIFCIAPVLASANVKTWPQLFVTRVLLGIGIGTKAATIPIFSSEVAPAPIRGALVMSWQFMTAFGIWIGLCMNLAAFKANDPWRWMLGSAFIPAVPLLVGVFFVPESPRWYISKGRYRDAYNSLLRLRHCELQAARDLYLIALSLEKDTYEKSWRNYLNRLAELWTVPRVRRATIAAGTVCFAQQACGINILAFYSADVFVDTSIASDPTTGQLKGLWASFGFGLINFLGAIPAFYTIDSIGRRPLLLVTFPIMAVFMLAGGLCYQIHDQSVRTGLVATFIYLFTAAYSPGEGPVPFVYTAEAFPLRNRELGLAFGSSLTFGFAGLLSMGYPRLKSALSEALGNNVQNASTAMFGIFAALNMVSWVLLLHLMPETRKRTLEELDDVFAVPTRLFVRWVWSQSIPWWWRRYILRQRWATLEPLYHFDADGDDYYFLSRRRRTTVTL